MSPREVVYMMNANRGANNQRNGTLFEYRVLREQKKSSIFAVRTAGSKSPFDVLVFKGSKIKLISCKVNGYVTDKEEKDLKIAMKKLPNNCICYIAILKKGKVCYKKLI